MLKQIKASDRPGCYLLLDFHPYLNDPRHIRLINEIALGYANMREYEYEYGVSSRIVTSTSVS